MEKQEIISFIEEQIAVGKITKNDLNVIFSNVNKEDSVDDSKKIINILYLIGAIIAVVGIIILLIQNWSEVSLLGRISITLGMSIAAYISGYLIRDNERNVLSQVLFAVSGILAPIGTAVLLYEYEIKFTPVLYGLISLVWAISFGVALWGTRKNILILLTTLFSTFSIYYFASEILSNFFYSNTLFKWLNIFTGIAYVLIAYYLKNNHNTDRSAVKNILYGIGTIMILGSGIALGGIFNLIMIAVIFGAFYASVYIKSRVILVLSALFLVAHIIRLTSEYFSDSLNWSIVLILIGFLIIGVGYATYFLNKKYISKN